jgi:aminocarboxymuconate-semialdehyde decarboxylase
MKIIDSHFHWWPSAVLEHLSKRHGFPRAIPNDRGGYTYHGPGNRSGEAKSWAEWYDLDRQLEHMDDLGHEVSVVCSIGPLSIAFSELPVDEGRELALMWNEQMAWAQRRYPGRVWGSAAVPLSDTSVALEVLEHAVNELGLMGVNLPGSIGREGRVDDPRLEPFYARLNELRLPVFLHPTDAVFADILDGYGGALHLSLGRVIEVSVAASRLVLSGLMDRYPDIKLVLSHTGGALPYQSGRMDKNTKAAGLPKPVSSYLRRMYTDTVSPHSAGMKFAIEYYGIDNVMYGTDYPCWDPETALRLLGELDLSDAENEKLFRSNAKRILGLAQPGRAERRAPTKADQRKVASCAAIAE